MNSIDFPSLDEVDVLIFDFDGVFTNNKVALSQEGVESVICDRRDGLGLDLLEKNLSKHKCTIDTFILSTESNAVVELRAKKLKLKCERSVSDKLNFYKEYCSTKYPKRTFESILGKTMFLANDLNDLSLFREVAWGVCPIDAHKSIRNVAKHTLDIVGGDGFVRAVIERLIESTVWAEIEIL